jgi:hypothetical protein
MIQLEDVLRDQRLGWRFALNGFLFAALGFAWNSSDAAAVKSSELAFRRQSHGQGRRVHSLAVSLAGRPVVPRGGMGRGDRCAVDRRLTTP